MTLTYTYKNKVYKGELIQPAGAGKLWHLYSSGFFIGQLVPSLTGYLFYSNSDPDMICLSDYFTELVTRMIDCAVSFDVEFRQLSQYEAKFFGPDDEIPRYPE